MMGSPTMQSTLKTCISLDLNEYPYELPRAMVSSLATQIAKSSRYPIGVEERVVAKVAAFLKVPPACVALTHGIDEALDLLIDGHRAMRFVHFSPGFDAYGKRLKYRNASTLCLPRPKGKRELAATAKVLTDRDFLLLANPDNPTGECYSTDTLNQLLATCGTCLVDETYAAFQSGSMRPSQDRPQRGRFRFYSFSKSFGLAGFRLGAVIGHASEIARLKSKQWFCNISHLSLYAVEAALENIDAFQANLDLLLTEKRRVARTIQGFGFKVKRTYTNFLLLQDAKAVEIKKHLLADGIHVKDTAQFGLADHLRISIGTGRENDALIKSLARYKGNLATRKGNVKHAK